jgi:hypothetical protein
MDYFKKLKVKKGDFQGLMQKANEMKKESRMGHDGTGLGKKASQTHASFHKHHKASGMAAAPEMMDKKHEKMHCKMCGKKHEKGKHEKKHEKKHKEVKSATQPFGREGMMKKKAKHGKK